MFMFLFMFIFRTDRTAFLEHDGKDRTSGTGEVVTRVIRLVSRDRKLGKGSQDRTTGEDSQNMTARTGQMD
jgi:hypothetical protein